MLVNQVHYSVFFWYDLIAAYSLLFPYTQQDDCLQVQGMKQSCVASKGAGLKVIAFSAKKGMLHFIICSSLSKNNSRGKQFSSRGYLQKYTGNTRLDLTILHKHNRSFDTVWILHVEH